MRPALTFSVLRVSSSISIPRLFKITYAHEKKLYINVEIYIDFRIEKMSNFVQLLLLLMLLLLYHTRIKIRKTIMSGL